jgi:phosphoribosylaminoimidazole-succinocarboxamide synthase
VWSVQILKPERGEIEGNSVWNYNRFHPDSDNFLIPLEVVFRFGTPRGSSLLDRARGNPGYLKSLGINHIEEGGWLSRPVIEFFSKLEPSDRALSPELALNFSGLANPEFTEMIETTFLTAVFLRDRFARAGIELWDGKFEFLRARKKIVLGDAITPDELRLVKDRIQISKEPIRQYYRRRHPEFLKKIAEAKPEAVRKGKKIGTILKAKGYLPPPLDPDFKKVVEDMYLGLSAELTGSNLLPPHRPLTEVIATIRKWVG